MITVATIAVGFDVDADLVTRKRVADAAFDLAEQAAREFLSVRDFGVESVVERGSLNVFVTVALTSQALLTALALYGSAAKGLDVLKADLKAMKKRFVKDLPNRAHLPANAFDSSRLTMEELSKIGRYIRDVEHGQLSPADGAELACAELALVDAPLDKATRRQLDHSFEAIAPKTDASQSRSDTAHAARPSGALNPPRRRVPSKPSRPDRVRIWRNPGESKKNREEP